MTDAEINSAAELLERTWASSFYKKDHQSLASAMTLLFANCKYRDLVDVIKDYAMNYDNVPTVATLSKLVHREAPKLSYVRARKYIEDEDGCGYLFNDTSQDYDCIWKWWWTDSGKSKMAILKQYGLIDY